MEKKIRQSGVLLHISSLPNKYSLGTFSSEAYKFVDWLYDAGFKVWQTLPISDCGYGCSPYSARSSFAINPYFMDLTKFLSEEELNQFQFNKYGDIKEEEKKILSAIELIYSKYRNEFDISKFDKDNKSWLDDYAIYKVIKSINNDCSWENFPEELRDRDKFAIGAFKKIFEREIDIIKFTQYILDVQWKELKAYANEKGISLFGDMPFYVDMDSSDIWANSENWKLGDSAKAEVAGVPPDYFNEEGQLWGNPIYDYEKMAKDNYTFIINRFKKLAELFDIIRIDHFIAFNKYWAIPKTSNSAINGRWVKGHGNKILKELLSKVNVDIIAEDLGIVTEEVLEMREKFGIPGLKILQFAFDEEGDHVYQPHNYEKNCVAYIGTHDNNTFMGLLNNTDWDKINRFKRYLRIPLEWGNDAVVDNAIISLYRSSARMIILTMQDILKLGSEARMNIPGVIEGNWKWQLDYLPDYNLCHFYKELSTQYCR